MNRVFSIIRLLTLDFVPGDVFLIQWDIVVFLIAADPEINPQFVDFPSTAVMLVS